jgi:hypothetical protein
MKAWRGGFGGARSFRPSTIHEDAMQDEPDTITVAVTVIRETDEPARRVVTVQVRDATNYPAHPPQPRPPMVFQKPRRWLPEPMF